MLVSLFVQNLRFMICNCNTKDIFKETSPNWPYLQIYCHIITKKVLFGSYLSIWYNTRGGNSKFKLLDCIQLPWDETLFEHFPCVPEQANFSTRLCFARLIKTSRKIRYSKPYALFDQYYVVLQSMHSFWKYEIQMWNKILFSKFVFCMRTYYTLTMGGV